MEKSCCMIEEKGLREKSFSPLKFLEQYNFKVENHIINI